MAAPGVALMSDTLTIFKIRRRIDGLYSRGGMEPSFSKTGKTWNNRGPLTNHLNIVCDPRVYGQCDVVEIEVRYTEADITPASDWIARIEAQKEQKERDRKDRQRQATEARERAELERLQNKYPKED